MQIFSLINTAQAGVISDAPRLSNVGLNVLSFLLSVFGVIAIMMLVLSGVMYVTAFGDESKLTEAKGMAKNAVLGIIVVMGSMVIMRLVGTFFE